MFSHYRFAVALTLLLLTGCGDQPTIAPPQEAAPGQPAAESSTVSFTIEIGDGSRKEIKNVPWKPGMTVLDAMVVARRDKGLVFQDRGSGATAFVESIGGQKNAGAAATDRNWLFFVNDKQADEGVGVMELHSGDRILWKYVTGR